MTGKQDLPHTVEITDKIDREAAFEAIQTLHAQPPLEGDPVREFTERFQSQAGIAQKIDSPDEAPRYVRDQILKGENSEAAVAIGSDPLLLEIPWGEKGQLSVTTAEAIQHGGIAVSTAVLAVAETGSLVLCSGPQNPTALNFLPDYHVVLVNETDVVGTHEQMWAFLRRRYPDGLPRAVNLVSGPSSTADVAVTFTAGAHGPIQVHALIVAATAS